MKKRIFYLLAILILTSCGSNNSSVYDNGKIADSSKKHLSISQNIDIRAFGQGVIDGKIKPSDNIETFACLDSIDSPNPLTRNFFFKVYKVIAQKSDGALSEVIGEYLKPYFQTFTKEALDNFKKLDKKEQEVFINNLAYEFSFSDKDYKMEIDNYFADINKTCKDCNIENELLKFIKTRMKESVAKMNQ